MRWAPTFFLPLLLLSLTSAAEARCTSPADAIRFEGAVRGALRCAEKQLFQVPPRPCSSNPPPACATVEHAAILELVYGASPAGIADPRTEPARCQMGVTQAAVAYLRRRIPDRLLGRRRAPLPRFLRKITQRCSGASFLSTGGGRLPAIAEACAPLAQSGDVDEALLARCVSARLEALVDATLPTAMRPNVVLVLTDDQRADTIDFMPTVLSEIAGRGVLFRQGLTTTSICAPSRASILTGLYAHNHGIVHNGSLIDGGHAYDHENVVAGWLRNAGYRTALFGKYSNNVYVLGDYKPAAWDEWQVFTGDGDNYRGYELNLNGQIVQIGTSESDYSTDRMARETMRFMRDHADEPFFVMYAPYAPHAPDTPAQRHAGTFAGLPPARPPNFRPADVSLKPNWVKFSKFFADPDPSPVDETRRHYLETLLAVDEAVGDISETLDQLGLTDNTLVIFLSDNGHHFGEQWWNAKFTSYEESIRVPFALRYPLRYPLPQIRDDLALNIDVAPTIAAATGVAAPPVNGQSLFGFLDGTGPLREDVLHESVTNYIAQPNQALRTSEWKYIHTDGGAGVVEELYDLVADPYELANLAFAPELQDLKQELAALLAVRRGE
jgi:N-acetylglucosamine-6-sulfatase